ncbi:antitoxin Xre/MbcA/ParS toxin-binding domain-containing protein [Stenotrophomonas maltophilia]|uniref:antitoxin Xre/MbcA/ParS toxin-binding domain-containing protein n=1 Tax=Stenotrophomonas maltophilia TaxID=40324 RepID=UPI00163DD427|nr:antitoxin Xre/MbcA/ParS toxin-binding domain-containing protein [Stenotrophomonas maltophilia]
MSMRIVGIDSALAGPALRSFSQIANAWSLSIVEQGAVLGQPEDVVLALAQTGVVEGLQQEALERISYVLGIYRALHTIFPNRTQADGWIRRPNNARLFNGAPALALMCSGSVDDLAAIREYLEAEGRLDAQSPAIDGPDQTEMH